MSQSLKQSFLLFALFLALNFGAAIVMQALSRRHNLQDFNISWILCIALGAFYWLTCQVYKGKYRRWLIPVLRIAFWALIVLSGFVGDNRMTSEDFLYASNENFLWWALFKMRAGSLRDINVVLELIFEDILLIALVEFALIQVVNAIIPWRNSKVISQE